MPPFKYFHSSLQTRHSSGSFCQSPSTTSIRVTCCIAHPPFTFEILSAVLFARVYRIPALLTSPMAYEVECLFPDSSAPKALHKPVCVGGRVAGPGAGNPATHTNTGEP